MSMTTPTPGQPLSEADVSLLPCPWCQRAPLVTEGRDWTCISCTNMECLITVKADISGGDHRAKAIAAWNSRPHAPVSRPGDGVEWPAVTNAWAETYCELTGKNPDGQQVTFVDGVTVTTFRDMAKREIEAMLCAAPKAAVRAIAALTPPAEPVSRPAGEGEREAGDYTMALAERQAFEDHTDLAAHIERMATTGRIGSMIEWDGFLRSLNVALLSPAAPGAGGGALADVAAERRRQIDVEGWTPEHDDEHANGELATAAACYAASGAVTFPWAPRFRGRHLVWPWSREWWKPRGRRSDLVRAGALIVAEIERLDRSALQPGGER